MKNKAPLAMIEQLVMVLVFALAAALCIQVFVFSDQTSRFHKARDRAVLEAQNAAEALKSGNREYFSSMNAAVNGNLGYLLRYDADWNALPVEATKESAVYILTAYHTESSHENLWTREVTVTTANGEELICLPVAGQNGR